MPDLTPERLAWGLTYYVVLLFSLSVHESAHGWMALRLGDDTAARQGRVTLNPLSHIDPVGTLLIPMLQIFWGGVPLLGWAKPTLVGPAVLQTPRPRHALVAGRAAALNLLLALLFTAALFLGLRSGARERSGHGHPHHGVQMNVVLALFNLVPLPPLDGSWVVSRAPATASARYDRVVQPYGQWIRLALFATGALGWGLSLFVKAISTFLYRLAL